MLVSSWHSLLCFRRVPRDPLFFLGGAPGPRAPAAHAAATNTAAALPLIGAPPWRRSGDKRGMSQPAILARASRLPWPLPALAAWVGAWLVHAGLAAHAVQPWLSMAAALVVPTIVAMRCPAPMRRVVVLAGFPLSLVLAGAGSLPAGIWLVPVLLLLALYPVRAWRDAPLYPTGARALDGLAEHVRLPRAPRILDAGCGLGHGLDALGAQWPGATLTGLEHSRPLAWLARWRCPRARIVRGDMWQHAWGDYDLVYLFQRPESMPRAWRKAVSEMPAGSWVLSLEFAVEGVAPQLALQRPGQRPLFAYRVPAAPRAGSGA